MKIDRKLRNRMLAYFWLILAACFMVCIFAPLETYLTNIVEFWYGYTEIVSVSVLVFAICFLCAWIPFFLLYKTKIFGYFYTLCFWLFVGFYIQGNYVARPYGIFDGREINWNDPAYRYVSLVSILIWVGVILATVICSRYLRGKIYRIASVACVVVMASQISTLGVLYVKNGSAYPKEEPVVITENKLFDLSKEKNILVLLLDTFDGKIMTELLETEYGESLKDDLTGFTFYPDTVGCYTSTRASLPYILTGTWYTNDIPYVDYVQKAYEENPGIMKSLEETGYSISVYTTLPEFVHNDADEYLNIENGGYLIRDYIDFVKNTYKMVVFNYVPHQMKKYFVMDYENINKTRMLNSSAYDVYDYDALKFYKKFNANGGFTFEDQQPAFKFYHTSGIHQSYTFDENMVGGVGLSLYDEAKGCMTLLRQMIADLKAEGVYDNTAMIVMADHSDGWRSTRGSNPLFMVKNFGETGELKVSDLAISYEDLEETVCSIAEESIRSGSIWSDDIKGRTERRFMWYPAGALAMDIKYLPTIRECIVKGAAYDPDSIRITGLLYDAGHTYYEPDYYKYELGTTIDFRNREEASKYYEYGIEIYGMSRDKESQLCFDVGNIGENLSLVFKYKSYFEGLEQRVLLYVNGTPLGEIRSEEPVYIDKKLIKDDGMLRLRFEYLDASTYAAQGENNTTYLRAIWFEELTIEQVQ